MSPDEPGSFSPLAWAHAESYTSSGKLKDIHEIFLFNSIDGLDVGDTCLSSAVDLLLNHSACTGNKFSSNPAGQQNLTSFVRVRYTSLSLDSFLSSFFW